MNTSRCDQRTVVVARSLVSSMEAEDHEEEASRSHGPSVLPRGSILPLNSKRLTQGLLKQLARAMELPTAASSNDLRQMIACKLEGLGRDPMNVQVVLRERARGPHLSMQDEGGTFVEAEPPEDQEDDREGEANPNNIEALQKALKEADEERRSLRDEESPPNRSIHRRKSGTAIG